MNNTELVGLVQTIVKDVKNYESHSLSRAYRFLTEFSFQFSYDLDSIKEDFLKVSDLTSTVQKLKELDVQGLALVLAHNAYTVGATLTGCMYTNPEDYDSVHTLACITDALACILVLQELKGDTE